MDITDPAEPAPQHKAFDAISDAASHGDADKELIGKALVFWTYTRGTTVLPMPRARPFRVHHQVESGGKPPNLACFATGPPA